MTCDFYLISCCFRYFTFFPFCSIQSFIGLRSCQGAPDAEGGPLESVSKVHHVEDVEDFDNQLKNAGNKVVLVDFFAVWCPPCKRIAPYLDSFAEKYADKLVILKVDVEDLRELSGARFAIGSMPTFIFFKNGESVERFSGANAEKIESTIQRLSA